MASLIPILAVFVVLVLIAFLAISILTRAKSGGKKRIKGRDALVKNAIKRLGEDPRDPDALADVGDMYYREENWDQAFKTYAILAELGNQARDAFESNLRWAASALKLGRNEDAYKGFSAARALNANNFEVNYNLGALEFQQQNYEKAIQLLNQAKTQNPEHAPTLRTLGHAFFRMKKSKEAMANSRRAIDLAPGDKESLFTLAECYHETNQIEQAQRIFNHLRSDPAMGAAACLTCGIMSAETRNYAKAIQDFELGLRHENSKVDVRTDLRYRLAQCYLQTSEIGKALALLKTIQTENPTYKDVAALIGRFQELNANKNLQVYLMAPTGDFVALCRKVAMSYYSKSKVKISKIEVEKNEWADILAEVDTPKSVDVVMFRFIRNQGSVGEIVVRDFHSHIRDVKATKGICISVGTFSEEARRYTEARLIDLIEKERFMVILNAVDAKIAQVARK
jgi:tetratricopeptide (TPR) repeat protein